MEGRGAEEGRLTEGGLVGGGGTYRLSTHLLNLQAWALEGHRPRPEP